ncbi:MAG: hypothetical protein IPM91_20135 [Bacteroidetes bacterium]|nr:hypothetical protein [Bacteroidota bacterium]
MVLAQETIYTNGEFTPSQFSHYLEKIQVRYHCKYLKLEILFQSTEGEGEVLDFQKAT